MQTPTSSMSLPVGPGPSGTPSQAAMRVPPPPQIQPPTAQAGTKRSASPQKAGEERPTKVLRPTGKDTFDLRAEEDAARRLNVGRTPGSAMYAGQTNRAKNTDLFDRTELRMKLNALARQHNLVFDEDAFLYLALAAETRIRSLLSSSVSAQLHRTSTSHHHIPPASSSGKPMWSHRVTSDTNAVMDALTRQNKEAEQSFRASRMDRIAKETEIQRAKDRAEKVTSMGPSDEADGANSSGPSTPREKGSSGGGEDAGGTPTFGAVKEKSVGSSGKKSGKKGGRDLSAEVAHKMSNATAMRSAGFKQGKYSWLTSVPSISSPLAGKKKKDKSGAGAGESPGGPESPGSPSSGKGAASGKEKDKEKGRSKLRDTVTAGDEPPQTPRKRRPKVSAPSRRMVQVDPGLGTDGEERRVSDDKALTMVDLVFALERDALGKGMGTADEVVRKIWATPGGPWGRDGEQKR